MDFFDVLKELRKGNPDINKASKAMKVLGWICIMGAIWNFAFYYIAPFNEPPFNILNLPPSFPYLALISLLFFGGLFLYSSQAIKKMNPIGKNIGQVAIVLLIVLSVAFMFFTFPLDAIPVETGSFSSIIIIFLAIFLAQFIIPAYYGVRYLGRLPVKDNNSEETRFKLESIVKVMRDEKSYTDSIPRVKYKDALFPFGLFGTLALLIAVPLTFFFAIERSGDLSQTAFIFAPIFLFILFAPIAYNYLPSSFQKERDPIASFTGGGSIFLFSGSWPFFRLIVYHDGIELRVMFHRFFIPYDKMEDLPEKVGFFSRGILIKSNLPGVPSGIRYVGFGIKRTVEIVRQYRSKFVNNN